MASERGKEEKGRGSLSIVLKIRSDHDIYKKEGNKPFICYKQF
jgi:hypothetical protein